MIHTRMVDLAQPARPANSVPDADQIAAEVIDRAAEYCAQKLGLCDGQAVLTRLQEDDKSACQYCTYSIAQQVGHTLGAWDDHVQAVYVVDYDATPDDLCFASDVRPVPIHVIVWTARKTRALDALIAVLDRALTQRYCKVVQPGGPDHLLDVQVVDDVEVENRTGYGAMLASIYQRPIRVWSR